MAVGAEAYGRTRNSANKAADRSSGRLRAAPYIELMSRVRLRTAFASWPALLFVVALLLSARTSSAAAGDVWSVLPFWAEGVDPSVAQTFREILEQEIGARGGYRFVPAPAPCGEPSCAHAASARLGARVVVFGSLRPLGTRILASATAVDGATGRVIASDRLGVDRVEDLEAVARRLAQSLTTLSPAADNARLGTITHEETLPDRRRGVSTNTSLRAGGILPLKNDGYASLGTGMAFDLGIWLEARHFAIEPRIGVRFDVYEKDRGSYFEMPFRPRGVSRSSETAMSLR